MCVSVAISERTQGHKGRGMEVSGSCTFFEPILKNGKTTFQLIICNHERREYSDNIMVYVTADNDKSFLMGALHQSLSLVCSWLLASLFSLEILSLIHGLTPSGSSGQPESQRKNICLQSTYKARSRKSLSRKHSNGTS